MKKTLVLLAILCISFAGLNASNFNNEAVMIPKLDTLIGYFDLNQLQKPPHNTWYEPEYQDYLVDTETLDKINHDLFQNITITIVMGTWCSDSQREIPRFVKILEYLEYDFEIITAIGVDRKKKAKDTNVNELNIEFVPTIIFYRDDTEIGRIIESPAESLEKDLFNLISAE